MQLSVQRGFSLLEFLVVMTIVAVMLALFVPWMQRGMDHYTLASATRDITSAIRQARSQAIAHNQESVIAFNVADKTYRIADHEEQALDDAVDIEVFAAEKEIQNGTAGIRFYPDGSTTGGRITLVYEDDRREIDVVWMTGLVKVLDAPSD